MKNNITSIFTCSIFLIAFCFVLNVSAQTGWTNAAPMTTSRYGTATGVIGGKIYVAGGFDTAYLNTLHVYDPAMNTWTTLAPMPAVRYAAFAGVIGGKLYVAGGTDGSVVAATLFVYDPLTNVWSTLASIPTARYTATGGVINGKLYVAGGLAQSDVRSDKLEVYDPATNSWATKTPMPNGARFAASGAVFFDKLYVAGGIDSASFLTKILEVYDTLTDSWTVKAPMPQFQYFHAAGALDGQFYNVGGTDSTGNVNRVQVYDPTTDKWSNAPVLPTLRRGLSAEVVGNSMYLLGGYTGTVALGTNEVFTSPPCTATPAGLVGWWAGDGDARDISGQSNNGTLQNGAPGFAVGEVGQTFNFNADFDIVQIPSTPAINLTSAGTLGTWVYFNTTGFDTSVIEKYNSGNLGSYSLLVQNGTTLRFDLYKGDGSSDFVTLTTPVSELVGSWNHLSYTWDGGTLRFYKNGLLQSSVNYVFVRQSNNDPLFLAKPGVSAHFQGSLDEIQLYDRALSAAEIGGIFASGKKGVCKSGATSAGANSQTIVGDQTITFQNATSAGTTSTQSIPALGTGDLPTGFTHTGLAYDISTTSTFTGTVAVCFNLPSINDATVFSRLKVMHQEGGALVDRTVINTFSTRRLCGRAASLSPFVIANGLAPTAAGVSIGGRVVTANGRGIRNARLTLTDQNGTARTALTGSFGYYRFDDVPAGQTVVIGIRSKQYVFEQPTVVLNVSDNVQGLDFIADN